MAAPLQTFTRPSKPWHGVDRTAYDQACEELLNAVETAVKKLNWDCGLTNENQVHN